MAEPAQIDHRAAVAEPAAHAGDYTASVETTFDPRVAAELWANASWPSVFNHPAWYDAAILAFGADRPLRIVCLRQGATTVAMWPLWLKRLGPRELFARVLEPIGARVTDYCIPLLRQGHAPDLLLTRLLREAAATLDLQTLLLWQKSPMTVDAHAKLPTIAQAQGLFCATLDHPCPAMSLPHDYETLEKRWRKNHRGDVRRQIKRLSTAGRLELVTARTRLDVEAALPRLYAMHTANWRARTGKADFEGRGMADFVTRLASTLPLELIEASEVRLDGAAISCHFGFRDRAALMWYKPAFDVGWAGYAPGKVHIALAARRSIEEGLQRLDFMQGNEPYKWLWADLTTVTKSFALARPMAYPIFAWNTAVRKFAAEYRV